MDGSSFDSLGRRRRLYPVSTGKRMTLQDRDLQWLQMLHEHGPLPSSFLLVRTAEMRRSEKRARERLTDLFNEENTAHGGPYLARPAQQFRTIDSRYNRLVHDLAPAGVRALKQAGLWRPAQTARTGPWLHGHMVACLTASIALACLARDDVSYIAPQRILERAGAELRCPVPFDDPASGRRIVKDLIPDALFGLEYHMAEGSGFRFFVLEADRAPSPRPPAAGTARVSCATSCSTGPVSGAGSTATI